jgi:hypothetical protein
VTTSVTRFLVASKPASLAGSASRTSAAIRNAMPAMTAPPPPAEPRIQAM